MFLEDDNDFMRDDYYYEYCVSDSGWYECQVSSTPKLSKWLRLEVGTQVVSFNSQSESILQVVVPRVEILGPTQIFVNTGEI